MSEQAKVKKLGDIAADWWASLQDQRGGRPNPLADRAARDRLRHSDKDKALVDPAFFDAWPIVAGGPCQRSFNPSLRLALVLVHVRDDEKPGDGNPSWRGFGRGDWRSGFCRIRQGAAQTLALPPAIAG
jgi:hypothetical protein